MVGPLDKPLLPVEAEALLAGLLITVGLDSLFEFVFQPEKDTGGGGIMGTYTD